MISRIPLGHSRLMAALGGLALGALILATGPNDDLMYGYGGYTVAALGAAAVLSHLLRSPDGRLARLLSARWLAALGVISYGMYLWHLPLAILTRPDPGLGAGSRILWELARLGIILLVTLGSYFLIERPFLRLKSRFGSPVR
jgi:peptidoglycan/LPS O-acetylase OafA/YrhL